MIEFLVEPFVFIYRMFEQYPVWTFSFYLVFGILSYRFVPGPVLFSVNEFVRVAADRSQFGKFLGYSLLLMFLLLLWPLAHLVVLVEFMRGRDLEAEV